MYEQDHVTYDITGNIVRIDDTQKLGKNRTFLKREFFIEDEDNGQLLKFEAVLDDCAKLDNLSKHDNIKLSFMIKCTKWTNRRTDAVSYFTNLVYVGHTNLTTHEDTHAEKVEKVHDVSSLYEDEDDDIPF